MDPNENELEQGQSEIPAAAEATEEAPIADPTEDAPQQAAAEVDDSK